MRRGSGSRRAEFTAARISSSARASASGHRGRDSRRAADLLPASPGHTGAIDRIPSGGARFRMLQDLVLADRSENIKTPPAAFAETLRARGLDPLTADGLEGLQANVGKLCNQTC